MSPLPCREQFSGRWAAPRPGRTRKALQRGRRGSTSEGSVRTAPLTQRFLLGVFLTPFLGIGS